MPQTSSILIQTSPALEESTGCTASFEVLQPEVVTPKRKNFCHAIFENSNGKCILLSGAIYGFIILTIWCQLGQDTTQETGERSGSTETDINCQTYLLVPIIFASLFYISYLLENWQYYTRQEDLITISIPSTMGWIDRMRCSLPIVWWKASCYHYTVFPCRHGLNRNTDTPTTNRSSSNAAYQRIISHSGACRYNYLTHGFRDVSSVIRGLDRTPLTRIHFNKSFVFFTQTAAKEYEEQRRSFFRDCQPRDDYMEMREGMDLMDIDFPEEVIVVRDLDRVPWWRRKSTFMVAVLCLQAAPLRILLALQTATLHYNVLKVFGMDERESNWPGPPGLGSFHADEPDLLPPSYSEIMLHEGSPVPAWGLGRLLLQRTGRLVKSATFGCSSNNNADNSEREKPVESYELSEGVRARGIDADGYNPLTPTSELKALRDVTDVLRRNGPRMFSQRFMMTRSNTAPVFSGAQRERLRIDGLRNFAYEAI